MLLGAPNGSRLSCGALKKKVSFNTPTRAASFKRMLDRAFGTQDCIRVEILKSSPSDNVLP